MKAHLASLTGGAEWPHPLPSPQSGPSALSAGASASVAPGLSLVEEGG